MPKEFLKMLIINSFIFALKANNKKNTENINHTEKPYESWKIHKIG